jgi:hypothetical protein
VSEMEDEAGNVWVQEEDVSDIHPAESAPPSKPRRSSHIHHSSSKDNGSSESVAPQTAAKRRSKQTPKPKPQPDLTMVSVLLDVSFQMFESCKN